MTKPTNNELARIFDEAADNFDEWGNLYTTRRRVESLAPHARGDCLEFGGGTGAVSSVLPDRWRVIHSDISPKMCSVARSKLGCDSICFDAEHVPVVDGSFDTAISSEMIYYLDHPQKFLAEVHRVLRHGGKLLICTTNPAAAVLDRARALLRRLGFKRMFFDDGSPSFISLRRLTEMLGDAGFSVELSSKIIVLPFAYLDWANRLLERTPLRHLGLFIVVVARKIPRPEALVQQRELSRPGVELPYDTADSAHVPTGHARVVG